MKPRKKRSIQLLSIQSTLIKISSLLIGISLLVIGNGLQSTLISIKAGIEGMSQGLIGLMMAGFYLGYILSSIFIIKLIEKAGHIRVFSALVSIASAIALLHLISTSPWIWILLRIFHGACYAGLIMVTESWINARTDTSVRGQVLSIYSMVHQASWALSQYLLIFTPPEQFQAFCVVSVLLSFALVPVALTNSEAPERVSIPRLSLKKVFNISPFGVIGTFLIGSFIGSFYGLAPVITHDLGFDNYKISLFMISTLLGAFVFQWPLGLLSDKIDRRLVIFTTSILSILACSFLIYNITIPFWLLLIVMFFFGGLVFSQNAICQAHVNDTVTLENLIPITSSLILTFGAGAVVGPIISGYLIQSIGPEGLFWFVGITEFILAIYCIYRMQILKVKPEDKEDFIPVYRATPLIVKLDDKTPKKRGVRKILKKQ